MNRALVGALAAALLIPSAWLALSARDVPHLGFFHDDALYWVCAQSLAQGDGYRITSFPGKPHQTKYPPGYPWLLSLIWRVDPVFPRNLALAALFAWLWVPPFLWVARVTARDLGLIGTAAWGPVVVLALSPYTCLGSFSLLSELPFACLLGASLALVERAAQNRRTAILAGAAAAAACLVRTVGIVLLVAAPAVLWMRGKRRSAVLSLCAALPPVVAWNLWSWSHRAPAHDLVTLYYTDYVGYYLSDVSWGSLPTLLWTNLDVLTSSIGGLLVFGIDDSFIGKSVLRVLACASIAGAVRLARRSGFTSYHAYALGYGLLLLSWNYTPDERFLLPVAPALLAGLFAELENLLRTIRVSLRRPGQRIAAVAVALALAPLAGVYVQGTYSALCQGLPGMIARNRRELDRRLPLYRWIRAHLPGAVLAYRDPLVYLYAATSSGRLVVPPRLLYSGDRPALEAHLRTLPAVARAHGLDHVVLSENDLELELGPNERAWAHKLMRSLPELEPVFQSDAGSVYRIRR